MRNLVIEIEGLSKETFSNSVFEVHSKTQTENVDFKSLLKSVKWSK